MQMILRIYLIGLLLQVLLPALAQSELPEPIEVFVASRCPQCDDLETYLKNRSVPYRRIDLEHDAQGERDYLENIGRGILPVGRVDGQIVRGYDMQRWRLIVTDYQKRIQEPKVALNAHRPSRQEDGDERTARESPFEILPESRNLTSPDDRRASSEELGASAYEQSASTELKITPEVVPTFQRIVPSWPQDEEERRVQAMLDRILASYDAIATRLYALDPKRLNIYKKAGRAAVCNLVIRRWTSEGTPENRLIAEQFLKDSMNSVSIGLSTKSLASVVRGLEKELNSYHSLQREEIAEIRANARKRKAADEAKKHDDKVLSESAFGRKLIPACMAGPFAQSFRDEVLTSAEKSTIEQKLQSFCTCMVSECAVRKLLPEVEDRIVTVMQDDERIRSVSDDWRRRLRQGYQVTNSDKFGLLMLETVDRCRLLNGMH